MCASLVISESYIQTSDISYLKDVVTRRNIRDVDPLAIDVSSVGVMAPRAQTLHT